jgi:hypothetical protein
MKEQISKDPACAIMLIVGLFIILCILVLVAVIDRSKNNNLRDFEYKNNDNITKL